MIKITITKKTVLNILTTYLPLVIFITCLQWFTGLRYINWQEWALIALVLIYGAGAYIRGQIDSHDNE
jgi:fatty acid desaturase